MYKFISVCFFTVATIPFFLRCTAIFAFAIYKNVVNAAITDISFRRIEMRNRIITVRVLRTIKAAAGQQTCEFRDRNSVKLFMEYVVYALLQIGDFIS